MVLGDFNDGENGDAVAYLATLGLTDALPLFHPGQFTWRHPSLANQFDEALDHVLFDEWVEPLNAYVVNQGRSDHIPRGGTFRSEPHLARLRSVPAACR
jgi:endonuclease/exonuclease/phosphatase (EEP) superfamily protein YafD